MQGQELYDITIADISLGVVSTVHLHRKGNKYRTVVISDEIATLIGIYLSRYKPNAVGTQPLVINRYHLPSLIILPAFHHRWKPSIG